MSNYGQILGLSANTAPNGQLNGTAVTVPGDGVLGNCAPKSNQKDV